MAVIADVDSNGRMVNQPPSHSKLPQWCYYVRDRGVLKECTRLHAWKLTTPLVGAVWQDHAKA